MLSILAIIGTVSKVGATSGTFYTQGGKSGYNNKPWNYGISSNVINNSIYKLTGTGNQPVGYKFSNVYMKLTMFCSDTNEVKESTLTNQYQISLNIERNKLFTNGTGVMKFSVSDSTYGNNVVTVYN